MKARRKRHTVYGLTHGRALVVEPGSVLDAPTQQTTVEQRRSRDGQHLTVTFGRSTGWSLAAIYANTGTDFFIRGEAALSLYDVADVDGLRDALRRIRE